MRTLTAFLLLAATVLSATAQKKSNPFVDPAGPDAPAKAGDTPPKASGKKPNPFVDPPAKAAETPPKAPKPTGAKPNPFTDPKSNPNTQTEENPKASIPDVLPVESKDPVVVPFTKLPSGHFLVKVKLNGTGPYNLIFDTGAPMMLLNTRIAKKAGIKGGGMSLLGGFDPQSLKSIEVGSAAAVKVPAVVLDHPTVTAISDAFEAEYGKIEGIVGFPFFARFATTVDYQKGEMRLAPNGYKPGDFMNDLQSRLTTMAGKKAEPTILAPAAVWGFNFRQNHEEKAEGVVVTTIIPGSPADKAGLKVDDVVLTIDGRWTDSGADLFRAVAVVKPGTTVVAEVKRGDKMVSLKVTPARGQ